ncbi:MAG: hypothetical protein ACQBVK_03465 [Candidatus Phytoplasma sp. TWB_XP]
MFLSNTYKKTLLFLIIIIFTLFIIIPHFTKAQSTLKLRYDYKTSIKISLRNKERQKEEQGQITTQVKEKQGPKLHLVEIEGDWHSHLDKIIKT